MGHGQAAWGVRCSALVGPRCHLGSKARRSTEAAAILHSLLESGKDSGVDLAAYLAEAARIAKLSGGNPHLMPWDFKPERTEGRRVRHANLGPVSSASPTPASTPPRRAEHPTSARSRRERRGDTFQTPSRPFTVRPCRGHVPDLRRRGRVAEPLIGPSSRGRTPYGRIGAFMGWCSMDGDHALSQPKTRAAHPADRETQNESI